MADPRDKLVQRAVRPHEEMALGAMRGLYAAIGNARTAQGLPTRGDGHCATCDCVAYQLPFAIDFHCASPTCGHDMALHDIMSF